MARSLQTAQAVSDPRHQLGKEAEERAARHFEASGSRVLARNFRAREGEIDLVVEELRPGRGLELVFVEVRARIKGQWVSGRESVVFAKRSRIERTARRFLERYRGSCRSIRFDVVEWDGKQLTHLRGAWIS